MALIFTTDMVTSLPLPRGPVGAGDVAEGRGRRACLPHRVRALGQKSLEPGLVEHRDAQFFGLGEL